MLAKIMQKLEYEKDERRTLISLWNQEQHDPLLVCKVCDSDILTHFAFRGQSRENAASVNG
jgi:hypothetical protein